MMCKVLPLWNHTGMSQQILVSSLMSKQSSRLPASYTANPGACDDHRSTIAPHKARWAGAVDGADKALCADTINHINQ